MSFSSSLLSGNRPAWAGQKKNLLCVVRALSNVQLTHPTQAPEAAISNRGVYPIPLHSVSCVEGRSGKLAPVARGLLLLGLEKGTSYVSAQKRAVPAGRARPSGKAREWGLHASEGRTEARSRAGRVRVDGGEWR